MAPPAQRYVNVQNLVTYFPPQRSIFPAFVYLFSAHSPRNTNASHPLAQRGIFTSFPSPPNLLFHQTLRLHQPPPNNHKHSKATRRATRTAQYTSHTSPTSAPHRLPQASVRAHSNVGRSQAKRNIDIPPPDPIFPFYLSLPASFLLFSIPRLRSRRNLFSCIAWTWGLGAGGRK